jgi:hypothetical protein
MDANNNIKENKMTNLVELKATENRELFNQVSFCAGALDKKAEDLYKKRLYVNGRCMMGTNGKRLHHARLRWRFFGNGTYKLMKHTKTTIQCVRIYEDIKYPDVKTIFREIKSDYDEVWCKLEVLENDDFNKFVFALARALPGEDHWFDIEHLKPLIGHHWDICVRVNQGEKPLVARGGDKTAFIILNRPQQYKYKGE